MACRKPFKNLLQFKKKTIGILCKWRAIVKVIFVKIWKNFHRAASVKFRSLVLQISPETDPFICASSIAKLALEIWRSAFLRPNQLINFPENGLNNRQKQSSEALRFFKLYSEITGHELRTAEWTIGEHCIGENTGYRVDALVMKENGKMEALEYLGCRFHGMF